MDCKISKIKIYECANAEATFAVQQTQKINRTRKLEIKKIEAETQKSRSLVLKIRILQKEKKVN
jgi:hypothetical protein